jgi:hypothetical protein
MNIKYIFLLLAITFVTNTAYSKNIYDDFDDFDDTPFQMVINQELITKMIHSMKSTSLNKTVSSENIQKYLLKKYKEKGGDVSINSLGDFISITVHGMKHEIIYDMNHWERLQIMLSLEKDDQNIMAILVLDGQYASGFLEPTEQGYKDMQPEFESYLNDYSKRLLLEIKEIK